MAAILGNSAAVAAVVVVVVVVRTRPLAIPLAMLTMKKSTHGFPFLSFMSMGHRLAALGASGALLKSGLDQLWHRVFT